MGANNGTTMRGSRSHWNSFYHSGDELMLTVFFTLIMGIFAFIAMSSWSQSKPFGGSAILAVFFGVIAVSI
jgi:hypothetical protein